MNSYASKFACLPSGTGDDSAIVAKTPSTLVDAPVHAVWCACPLCAEWVEKHGGGAA